MAESEIPSDRRLWRDFDWDTFLQSKLKIYADNPAEMEEAREAVRIARLLAKTFDTTHPGRGELSEVVELEKTPPAILIHAAVMLAQIAGLYYTGKHAETYKLTFAVTAISHAATCCREKRFEKVLPILRRFATEFGD
jgi:hypothetical protein